MRKNTKCKQEHFDKIAYKNHLHSNSNPYSQNQQIYSIEEIRKSGHIYGPMTKLHCCPTSDGAAAVILCSEDYVIKHNLIDQAVEIMGYHLQTDNEKMYENHMNMAGYEMSRLASENVYR